MFICLTAASEYAAKRDDSQLEALLKTVASGDRSALTALYEQTRVAVYSYCLSLLKNVQDAEDAMQDTFIDLYRAAENYRPQGKPLAWIITLAKNRCLMRLRERQKSADLPEEDWERALADNTELEPIDRLAIRACMEQLNDEERQIVALHAVSGLKHREIAQIVQKPLPTVLSKYHRAIKKMREIFAEGEFV